MPTCGIVKAGEPVCLKKQQPVNLDHTGKRRDENVF